VLIAIRSRRLRASISGVPTWAPSAQNVLCPPFGFVYAKPLLRFFLFNCWPWGPGSFPFRLRPRFGSYHGFRSFKPSSPRTFVTYPRFVFFFLGSHSRTWVRLSRYLTLLGFLGEAVLYPDVILYLTNHYGSLPVRCDHKPSDITFGNPRLSASP